MIDSKLDAALRALARTQKGPFRVFAYTTTSPGQEGEGEGGKLTRELGRLARKEATDPNPVIVVDAAARPAFRREILSHVEALGLGAKRGRKKPEAVTGRGAPAKAKERLAEVSAGLPALLADVDRKLAGARAAGGEGDPDLPDEEMAGVKMPPAPPAAPADTSIVDDDADPAPLVLVRRLLDLGPHAGIIAETIAAIVSRGGHVAAPTDDLDTRTREGKIVARALIRVGRLQTQRAKARGRARVDRQRGALKVYGPVPFGFRKKGDELIPIDKQLATVRRIRELTHLEQTPVAIAAKLNSEKRTWKDGTPWTWRRVKWIQKNSIYDQVLRPVEKA